MLRANDIDWTSLRARVVRRKRHVSFWQRLVGCGSQLRNLKPATEVPLRGAHGGAVSALLLIRPLPVWQGWSGIAEAWRELSLRAEWEWANVARGVLRALRRAGHRRDAVSYEANCRFVLAIGSFDRHPGRCTGRPQSARLSGANSNDLPSDVYRFTVQSSFPHRVRTADIGDDGIENPATVRPHVLRCARHLGVWARAAHQ